MHRIRDDDAVLLLLPMSKKNTKGKNASADDDYYVPRKMANAKFNKIIKIKFSFLSPLALYYAPSTACIRFTERLLQLQVNNLTTTEQQPSRSIAAYMHEVQ